ncbi:hypothetical protein [Sulfitobacter geojensis]|uniref:Uncharacterized protein n=1 Tax=Sulfitobacter geojensis TaxID=1342299 RepID=A0AAE2VX77_9RHOB|nr:hypothetical protein [Sulfitobacter geojensis]MBM1688824.1 hypothetical protein [Sulfitobacter geojensis]MBM1692891.1 hypothetical protein [Sulfitobacter geojensis]MBM1705057.1 hypothetical protein [Sulfitobacter geojensis]MBM1709115.1 hypothetical protein [Sulfitobacter geojensis]MBM1713180.1 hypothetical protein [Sulfitobacter geojensis]
MSKPAIQLSPERHAQVYAIGQALGGLTYAEAVGRMVNAEIEKGTIGPDLQGIDITATEEGLALSFDGQPAVLFSKTGVSTLANDLREFATKGHVAQIQLNVGHNYKIERKGSGVLLTLPLVGGVTKPFAFDLAHDLANLLEQKLAT